MISSQPIETVIGSVPKLYRKTPKNTFIDEMSESEDLTPAIKPKRCFYSETDVKLLQKYTKKYERVLTNNKTNGITPAMKEKVWEDILLLYNAYQTGGRKTVTELKKKHQNMKALAKKELVENAKAIKLTGGGTASLKTTNDFDFSVKQITGLDNPFDDDAMSDGAESTGMFEEVFVQGESVKLERLPITTPKYSNKRVRMSANKNDLMDLKAESLQLDIENKKLDIKYKKLLIKKTELEVIKLMEMEN